MTGITARWGAAIGGSNAITVWSWIITFPLALILGVSGGLILGLPLPTWLLAVVVTQVLLVAPLVLARLTWLSARPRAPRPVAAVLTFALIGALRAVLLVAFAGALGVPPSLDLAAGWVVSGIVYGVVALSAIAVVVDGIREHRAALQRLESLRASLAHSRAHDASRRDELAVVFLEEVDASVTSALDSVRGNGPGLGERTRAEVSASLRSVAETVVRPLSHRLAEDDAWVVPLPAQEPEAPGRGQRARELLAAMRPATPLLPVAAIEALALPYLVQRIGPEFALLNLVVGSVVLFMLCWLIARLWTWRTMTVPRLLGLAAAYAVAGGLASAAIDLVAHALGMTVPFFWTTVAFVPVAALAISLLAALDERRRAVEEETADALAAEAQETARLREGLADLRRRLARVLHSTVQGEFIAAALALAAQDDASVASIDAELDDLEQRVRDRIRVAESPTARAEERVRDLSSLWADVLAIETVAEPEAWRVLDADPALLQRAIDVVAEGLTNAVRHGSSRAVVLSLALRDDAIVLCIAAPGVLSAAARPSLGMRTVAESADTWELAQVDDRVDLTVSLRPR